MQLFLDNHPVTSKELGQKFDEMGELEVLELVMESPWQAEINEVREVK